VEVEVGTAVVEGVPVSEGTNHCNIIIVMMLENVDVVGAG
jgi:hypothetical protein